MSGKADGTGAPASGTVPGTSAATPIDSIQQVPPPDAREGGLWVRAKRKGGAMSDRDGILAFREYRVPLPDSGRADFALALCDPSAEGSEPAELAKARNGRFYGLLTIRNVPDVPRQPIVWIVLKDEIVYVVAKDDPPLGPQVLPAMIECLRRFFKDVRDIAPDLEQIEFRPRQLH
jgi:hypothetical protein